MNQAATAQAAFSCRQAAIHLVFAWIFGERRKGCCMPAAHGQRRPNHAFKTTTGGLSLLEMPPGKIRISVFSFGNCTQKLKIIIAVKTGKVKLAEMLFHLCYQIPFFALSTFLRRHGSQRKFPGCMTYTGWTEGPAPYLLPLLPR